VAYPQLPCMDEMTCARSLFHAFFADTDGWHVAWLSINDRKGGGLHACNVSAPANLRPDHGTQRVRVDPGLACSVCDNHQQATNYLTRPLRAFCCSQCSTHVHILKIDNGETKTRTRINFDVMLTRDKNGSC